MDINSIPQRQCTKCKNFYPATQEYFSPRNDRKSGLSSRCKSCRKEDEKQRRSDPVVHEQINKKQRDKLINPEYRERKNKQRRDRYANDPEYREQMRIAGRIDSRLRRATNPEFVKHNKMLQRIWGQTERGKILRRAMSARRRAKIKETEGTYTAADIDLQYRSQEGKCWHCGKSLNGVFEIDHLIALDKGGTNWPNNLVCSCRWCNRSKGAKSTQEWNGKLF